jgi:hypothetical protein
MKEDIPWKAPAVIGILQSYTSAFLPEMAGFSLNEALVRATDPDTPVGKRVCIMVNWHGREVLLHGRRIFQLAAHPDRPPLPE